MKTLKFLTALTVILAMMSCASMNQSSNTTSAGTNNTAAYTAGSACGGALLALYKQYKTDGKVDLSNPTNLLNLATLAGSASNLKANLKDKTYYQGFANGTVSGSNNTVSTSSVNHVLNSLTGIDLSSFAKKPETQPVTSQTTETISSVISLLNLLK